MSHTTPLAAHLQTLRQGGNLTLPEIAIACQLSTSTVSAIFRGKLPGNWLAIQAIIAALQGSRDFTVIAQELWQEEIRKRRADDGFKFNLPIAPATATKPKGSSYREPTAAAKEIGTTAHERHPGRNLKLLLNELPRCDSLNKLHSFLQARWELNGKPSGRNLERSTNRTASHSTFSNLLRREPGGPQTPPLRIEYYRALVGIFSESVEEQMIWEEAWQNATLTKLKRMGETDDTPA